MSFSILIIISLVVFTNQSPQILEDGQICKFSFEKEKKNIEYNVPSYITAEASNLQLIFSLCAQIPAIFPNDGSCSKTCIYNKNSKSLITGKQTAEKLFEVEGDSEDEIVLTLTDELKCTPEKNYKIVVYMIKSDRLLKKPRLIVEDCDITVEMLKPDYEPPCTHLLSSKNFINLKPLKSAKISIPWEGKEFKIALCGTNKDCEFGNAGCLKDGTDTQILGTTSSQKVKFDIGMNELKVVASYKERNRKVRNMEIIIKCNWEVPNFSNAKYIKPSTQGRRYKFEVDSSFGCVKISSKCLIEDRDNGLLYDLRGLAKSKGVMVRNTTKLMLMNICGDLKAISNSGNKCEDQHSQICEIDANIYTNKGSIPSFETTYQHNVKVYLRNGQQCNGTSSYSTEIEIKCSVIDKGPVFVKSENCVTQISWETPEGCPKYHSEADGCKVSAHLGGINIENLYRENDRIHSFSANDKFMFNVCGKIHSNCSSESQVSACYVRDGTEHIIGWNKPKISYTNGTFQLKYSGVKCKTANKYASLTINLYCSRAQIPTKTKLNKRDSCTFEADIYTLSACLNRDKENCVYENDAVKYDLTPLMSNETNYQVQDENDGKLVYFLNVCQSLINENGLIPGNSMIYLLDKSKLNVWERFESLGKIARPVLSNGKLVTNSIFGKSCNTGEDYSSGINFECSDKNERPKLLERKNCRFEFLWKTKYACPMIKPGGRCLLQDGDNSTGVPSDIIKFENEGNTYKFSLCAENYEICKDKSCLKHKLTRKIFVQNRKVLVELNLKSTSTCTNNLLTVNLTVQCDQNKDEMSILTIGGNNCHVDLLMKTSLICGNGSVIVARGLKDNSRTLNDNSKALNGDYFMEPFFIKGHFDTLESTNNENNNLEPRRGGEKSKKIVDAKNLKINVTESITSNISIPQKVNSVNFTSINKIENSEVKNQKEIDFPIDADKKIKQIPNVETLEHDKHDENIEQSISVSKYNNQKCDAVKIGTKIFDSKFIESSTITGKNNYTINFSGTSTNCGGRICRNATPILHFIENCPEVIYNENHISLNYTVKGECLIEGTSIQSTRTVDFKIGIELKCNGLTVMTVSNETNCFVGFVYYSPQICDRSESSNGSSVVFLSVGVTFVAIALLIIGYLLYQKYVKRFSYNSYSNPERIHINHSKLL